MQVKIRYVMVLCALALGASLAKAQDFYWNTASARSNGMGGVYVASSSDVVDALAANPAGLSVLRGRNLDPAANSPVPSSTPTPLTAAILSNESRPGSDTHMAARALMFRTDSVQQRIKALVRALC